jgi:pilus assembly protein Flp/PilA
MLFFTEERLEKGASLIEYALLVALVAMVAVGAITIIGTSVSSRFSTVASGLNRS